MRILHYFLGFPPYRSGGMIAFCMDLMRSQREKGHEVCALWPGMIPFVFKKVRIIERKMVDGIRSFELISPLPVPLDEGIIDPKIFMQACDNSTYNSFLNKTRPDIIHVHTLMGIHKEFFEEARKLKIKTIFTTHDYFGICPKVTFYRNNDVCVNPRCYKECALCNQGALSLKKIIILQSPIYRLIKNTRLVKKLRMRHRRAYFEEDNRVTIDSVTEKEVNSFEELRLYYTDILSHFNYIHCNSTVAREVYSRFIDMSNSKVITISNRDICDNRLLKHKKSNILRILYLSPAKSFKGYNVLISALDELWEKQHRNFELHIYTDVPIIKAYMKIKGSVFKRDELADIFSEADVLVAPSIWYETFGFTVLEALSYGVPVIVSDHVGAKDVVENGGIVIPAGSVDELKKIITELTTERLMYLKDKIRTELEIKTWSSFINEFDDWIKDINNEY